MSALETPDATSARPPVVPEPVRRTPAARIAAGLRWWRRADAERPWVRAATAATTAWLTIHAAYAAVTIFVGLTAPSTLGDYHAGFGFRLGFRRWFQWDSEWYLHLARYGYGPPLLHGDERDAAFFPLYPVLIRLADEALPGGWRIAAAVVSNVAMLGALVLLFRLTERELSVEAARRSLWYLTVFPTAFFLAAPYPSSVFLVLALGSFYAMRTGHWWTAGLLACLTSATRSSGLLLALPFCYEYLRQHDFRLRRIRADAAALALIPVGLLAFMAYTHVVLHDAFAFVHAQKVWSREFAVPGLAVLRAAGVALRSQLIEDPINALELGTLGLALVALVLAVWGPWRLRRDQFALPLFGFALVVFVVSFPPTSLPTEPLLSASRHVLEVFPAFMMLGAVLARPSADRVYTAVCLSLQGLLLLHYLHRGWVA